MFSVEILKWDSQNMVNKNSCLYIFKLDIF